MMSLFFYADILVLISEFLAFDINFWKSKIVLTTLILNKSRIFKINLNFANITK